MHGFQELLAYGLSGADGSASQLLPCNDIVSVYVLIVRESCKSVHPTTL